MKLIRNILKAPAIFIFKIAGEKNNTHNGIIYHYDERRENSPIIKIIDEFNMKKNNLVKSICNGVFKIAYCI